MTTATFDTSPSTDVPVTTIARPSLALAPLPPLETSSFLVGSFGLTAASSSLPETINSLDEVQGTLTLSGGLLTTDLVTPFGSSQETYDLVALATDLNETFQGISGSLTLSSGLASGNLIVEGEEFVATDFEFASLISNFVSDFLSTLDGTVPFANGQLAIDLPTPFGDVEGTIGFGSGALVVNLDTPFAPLNFSLDFPDDAQFTFPIPQLGTDAILNLATGQIEADLIPIFAGSELVIPINALTGNVTFADGIANLTLQSGLATVDTQFNFAAEVEESLLEFLSTATGVLSIGNGELSANLQTDLGAFAGILPASELFTDLIATLPQYAGTITLAGGSATVDLTTPDGVLQGAVDYGQYLDAIASFVEGLVVA
ncbi:MAG: hypothetical protein NW224_00495 [Leptolyngbyaceae cyanobacterium bins.302]|nr:hypothetical protein [Leptolyngbyaceae cyanobacterium bins.302]